MHPPPDDGSRTFLDRDAFAGLFDQQHQRVYSWFVRHGFSSDEGYDLTAEVFARAWEAKSRFDLGRGLPGDWLIGFARNIAREAHTSNTASRAALARLQVDFVWNEDNIDYVDELNSDVADALHELPHKQRDAVQASVIDGATPSELAKASGVSSASIRMNIKRGLDTLRRRWSHREES